MRPTFFELELPWVGVVAAPAYLTLLLVGFLLAVWLARREARRRGLDEVAMIDLGLLMLVLGVVGARLLSVLADGQLTDFVHLCRDPALVPALDSRVATCSAERACELPYVCDLARGRCHPPRDCLAALKFWQGGLTFYGGLLLAVPGGIWLVRRRGLPLGTTLDIAAPCVMLGLACGRLGCFLNGCCYGAFTNGVCGVSFPGRLQPVHPTQLYEALVALLLFSLLYARLRRRSPAARAGGLFGGMLLGYGLARFVLEFYRADPRGSLGALSTSQLISLPLIALGVALLWRARASRRAAAASPPAGSGGGGR